MARLSSLAFSSDFMVLNSTSGASPIKWGLVHFSDVGERLKSLEAKPQVDAILSGRLSPDASTYVQPLFSD